MSDMPPRRTSPNPVPQVLSDHFVCAYFDPATGQISVVTSDSMKDEFPRIPNLAPLLETATGLSSGHNSGRKQPRQYSVGHAPGKRKVSFRKNPIAPIGELVKHSENSYTRVLCEAVSTDVNSCRDLY